ncbi:piggyBac transposable element-derived protein 4-like [Palaemon carinicauda]|uniref:piggyBac transposable element-derived protein 4-like n=1 Tax=Palaemon carinicauda TaxID=392227 RepID=UPI0035B5E98A
MILLYPYPAVPVPHLSPVEMRSRKRRRGPLCPAEGLALKRLPDNSYMARDNTKWHSEPNPTMPPILKIDQFDSAGPTMAVFGCRTPAEVFDKFLTNIMLAEVVIHTNDKILTLRNKYKRQNDPTFKDVTLMELRAFLGILIMTGARKDNHLTAEEMFSKSLGCPFYRSIMSERRFAFIQRALRFDSIATREERVTHDKFAPIRNLWDQVIANCIANYEPSGHLTVDEQLLGFRGRCRFRMYIPNNFRLFHYSPIHPYDLSTVIVPGSSLTMMSRSYEVDKVHSENYKINIFNTLTEFTYILLPGWRLEPPPVRLETMPAGTLPTELLIAQLVGSLQAWFPAEQVGVLISTRAEAVTIK